MATRKATDLLVVHCAATSPSMDIGSAEIDRWHRQRGFFMCGYHYVIRRNGFVECARSGHKCRGENDVGAHAQNHNHNSIGICLVGGVAADGKTPEDNFTPEQMSALGNLLAALKFRYPKATVLGHRDLPGVRKACPSFDVKAWAEAQAL